MYILCRPVGAPVTSRSRVRRLAYYSTQVDILNTKATSLDKLFHKSGTIEVWWKLYNNITVIITLWDWKEYNSLCAFTHAEQM